MNKITYEMADTWLSELLQEGTLQSRLRILRKAYRGLISSN